MKHSTLIQSSFEQLTKEIFEQKPKNLYNPIVYNMSIGGKRIRPLLMLYACELFNGDIQNCIKAAFGVELFHNFTLLHDDIMDNAYLRRGKPSVYKKFGIVAGILSGDVMMMHGQKLFFDSLPQDIAAEVTKVFIKTGIEVCEGQQMDMDFEVQDVVSEAEYLEMIRLKTAVLIAASLEIGAIIAGASSQQRKNIYDFGIALGIAFQLRDDYLDSFGTSEQVGKKSGGDITENKKTIILIHTLLHANKTQLKKINRYLSSKDENQEKIQYFKSIFESLGSKQYIEDLLDEFHQKSIDLLDSINPNKEKTKELRNIASIIVKRGN
jgi:geranylgeranyl diphosphate synthase type II